MPPGYKGKLPTKGYYIVRFETMDANYFIRGIVIKGDVKGAADMIAKSRVYPYSERANRKPNKVLRVTGKYINTIEPEGLAYWKRLSEVINNNPVEEQDRFFMAMLKPLGIEKGKPFAPDARQKRILEEGARLGHAMAQTISFDSRLSASPAYPGKNWMNVFVMNTTQETQQESEYYTQLDERLNYLYLGTFPAQAMNLPFPSEGQRYLESFKDKDGNWLDGSKNYKLHVPANPPAEQFWSVTIYDVFTRSMTMNKETGLQSLPTTRSPRTPMARRTSTSVRKRRRGWRATGWIPVRRRDGGSGSASMVRRSPSSTRAGSCRTLRKSIEEDAARPLLAQSGHRGCLL